MRELEQTNEALGKAIGLLHAMSEQEPDAPRRRAIRGFLERRERTRRRVDRRDRVATAGAGDGRVVAVDVALPVKPRRTGHDPIPQKDRAYPSRIDQADRDGDRGSRSPPAGRRACRWITRSPDTWDAGVMLAPGVPGGGSRRRSRIKVARPVAPTPLGRKPPRQAPVLKATGPGRSGVGTSPTCAPRGGASAFKAYSIIDIYSRMIVGWRVEERECDDLAKEMFEDAFARARTARGGARGLRAGDALHRPQRLPRRLEGRARPTTGRESPTTTRFPNRSSAQ